MYSIKPVGMLPVQYGKRQIVLVPQGSRVRITQGRLNFSLYFIFYK